MNPKRLERAIEIALLASLAVLGARPVRAQTSDEITLEVSSDGWEVWMGAERCARPCRAVLSAGEADVRIAPLGATSPRHRVTLGLREHSRLHVGRLSRHDTRIAGGVTLGAGWAAAAALAIGLGAWAAEPCPPSSCLRFPGLTALVVVLPSALLGGLCSLIGGLLLTSGDEPYVEVESGRRRWRVVPTPLADGAGIAVIGVM